MELTEEGLTKSKFSFGQLVMTPGIQEKIVGIGSSFERFLQFCLIKHSQGDWGSLCDEDKKLNDGALLESNRLHSSYESPDFGKVWIITEWDRSATTVLLPEEY